MHRPSRACSPVNGMSYHGRAGENANSAVIVTVSAGRLRRRPSAGRRKVPEGAGKTRLGRGKGQDPRPAVRRLLHGPGIGSFRCGPAQYERRVQLRECETDISGELAASIQEGISRMDRKIRGFAGDDVLLSGVESRTSSPVRIPRTRRSSLPCPGSTPAARAQDTPEESHRPRWTA